MSGPCQRPECGGEVHTDGWGTPIQCPARRCPRCDCPDGHTQCEHCKVCPHAGGAPSEPRRLTRDQLAPIATGLAQRVAAGQQAAPPPFPACGSRPAALDMTIGEDTVFVTFLRCAHAFAANRADLYEACNIAFQRERP